ncbi:MAG: hypothetical protein PVF85_10915 [Anaerolineales bacterium]
MIQLVFGIFIILHGLVHMWYVTLSQRWVAFQPEMGWTGNSWLFTGLLGDASSRVLATVIYTLTSVAFLIGGFGVFARTDWWSTVIIGAAIASSLGILFFWDGSPGMLVQKGLLGLIINIVIIALILVLDWPSALV